MVGSTRQWETIERWVAPAFLGAGGVWLVAGVLSGLDPMIDRIAGVEVGVVVLLVVFSAMVIGFVGLVGMYRTLVDPAPRLTGTGILVAAQIAVVNTVFLLAWVSDAVLPVPWPIPADEVLFGVWSASFLGFPVGPALFGIASLRTGVFSRPVGFLLVVPVVLWIVWVMLFAAPYSEHVPTWPGLRTFGIVAVVIAVTLLAIGYLLHTDGGQPEHTDPSLSP